MNRLNLLVLTALLLLLTACGEPDKPSIPLNLAVERGDINQIERHILWGSDINKFNIDGEAPIHVAARQGSYIVVKLLTEKGADINILDKQGISPLGRAILSGRTQIADYLIKQGATQDPDGLLDLMVKAGEQDRDVIPLLIKWGAQINHQNEQGQTPLALAVSTGNLVLVKHLIENGADVNLADNAGQRPLTIARQRGDENIIRMLERNGAQ
ncbi:ankyrin repeat domain-containing protein [Sedimenticola selenatireducens]|uniref:Ankyrin repeat domain-containing protein n=1 Tax=Sedimenticola selenatireducens TaxID=191960 RepID=A0A2N6CRT4_9GAMM|nr:ankyrin repeat domain-containing protein [Sedimenticola selenatireducens]PLX59803.1 MAG: ankyrin repeat domain-containing protein [Sedimenticola selenatireducens]